MSKELRMIPCDDSSTEFNSIRKGQGCTTIRLPLQEKKLKTTSSVYSLSSYDDSEIKVLQIENAKLKNQIKDLKRQLKGEQAEPSLIQREYKQDNQKLKRVIEKSFYSIRKMQTQSQMIKKQFKYLREAYEQSKRTIQCLEQKNLWLKNSIASIKDQHKEEIDLVWGRVSSLQDNLEAMARVMEEDKKQWKLWKHNKQYSNRSSRERGQVSFMHKRHQSSLYDCFY